MWLLVKSKTNKLFMKHFLFLITTASAILVHVQLFPSILVVVEVARFKPRPFPIVK